MNGQMTKYEKYLQTLDDMKEPKIPDVCFEMRKLIEYAKQQGKRISELSATEKQQFIKYH
ncbi:hypothetical protein [Butyrivibrio sp. AE2032]|uniref:hypothetical protein n=1 Tax=Butyrivibrio sp. AE2032 TaxID=1458463 RepID=UPI00055350A8|nr:hypothetical protein [Butyrivibrio sp. AE2032]